MADWDSISKPAAGTAREANPWDDISKPVTAATAPPLSRPIASESGTLFGDAKAETVLGEIGAGLQKGARQVVSTAPTMLGVGAQIFEDVSGVDTRGLPTALVETGQQIAEGGSQRGIARVEDLELMDPITWARYVAGVTGEAVPFIVSIMSGAGGARLLANKLAAKGVPASTRAGIIRTAARKYPEVLGAGVTASLIEAGGTAQELEQATGQVEPYAALAAGTAKGALESVFPLMLARTFGLTGQQSGHLLDRLFVGAATRPGRIGVGMATESATEGVQEEIDLITRSYMDENYSMLSPDAYSRRLNAYVAGGVGGGVFSAMTPMQGGQALNEKLVRDAAGDTPYVTGQGPNELPTVGPEGILRAAPVGGLSTTMAATAQQRDELLQDSDYRLRGLVAPVIPNMELTFGTQEQAQNDGAVYGGAGFMALDPSRVTRGDVSASVEDLPYSLADPRIDFTNPATIGEASKSVTQTIKAKNAAAAARSGRMMEQHLQAAQVAYREAMNQGARVEPYPDGQIVLRNLGAAAALLTPQASVQSQLSEAGLLEGRTLPNGKTMYVFDRRAEEEENTPVTGRKAAPVSPKGRKLDLEAVDPNLITALPGNEMIRRVRADAQVSRKGNLGRARGLGIRFKAGTSVPTQTKLLLDFSRLLGSITATTPFNQQPAEVVDRFMQLVDQGLRLDVRPQTEQFAVLDQLENRQLVMRKDSISPVAFGAGRDKRIVKGRARSGGPRVSRTVQFYDKATADAFLSQFHRNNLSAILVGEQEAGTRYKVGPSELLNMLRDIVKPLGLRTDYVIEIVPPTVLPNSGVKYVEKDIVPPGGKNAQSRSVIMVNPWFYGNPTKGGKKLTRPESSWALKGEAFYKLESIAGAKGQRRKVMWKGELTTIGAVMTELGLLDPAKPLDANLRAVLNFGTQPQLGAPTLEGFKSREQFALDNALMIQSGNMVPTDGVVDPRTVLGWLKAKPGETVAKPERVGPQSVAGKAAAAVGGGETKMYVSEEATAEFYADFAVEVSESILAHEWAGTDAAVQELIQNAWRREMHLAEGMKPENQIGRVLPHPIVDRTIAARKGQKHESYKFEEWMVNQLARVFTGGQRVDIGPVAAFFKKTGAYIAGVIDNLYKRATAKKATGPLALDPMSGMPNAVVARWLGDLEMRDTLAGHQEPFLDKGTRDALIDSINKNVAAFKAEGIDQYVVATPQRASTYQVRRLLDILPKGAQYDASRAKLECLLASADRHNTMMEWLLGIHQMADMNPHIEGLRTYTSATRSMENAALTWATQADQRLRDVQKLGKAQIDALFKLVFDLDQMVYLTPKEKKDKVTRWPKPQELLDLVRKHGLNGDAFKQYVEMRADFTQFISYLEEVSISNATETITDPERLLARIQQIRGETEQIRRRPYFPHMRFGKYATTVRDSKGKVVHFEAFESQADRDKANVEIAKKYRVPEVNTITEDYLTDTLQQWQGLPRYALQNVIKQLGLDSEDLTAQQKKDKAILEAMADGALPTESFRRNLVNRKNVPGYSLDGMRAYANYFARAARFVARMEYARTLENAIQDVRATASPITKDVRSRIADFMSRHFEAQMEPAADWAELRGLGFLWYFAFVPAAAFVNLTQVPLVAMPFLASKFGDLKTMGRVTQAYAQNTKEFYDWLKGKPVEDTPKSEALEEAHFNRLIDDGFAVELAAISQGPVLQATLPGNQISRGLRRFAQWGTAPFALAERVNRSVTFRATFDMAMADNNNAWIDEVMEANKVEADQLRIDRGWSEIHLRSYMAAAEAVRKTQFEYARWSRPKLMEGVRGVIFMFKTYLQNMLYFLFRNDRKVQVRYMLLMLATAGIMGVPGAEDATELAKFLARQFGLQFDMEREIRRMMVDWGADDVVSPDVVLHGASREGFGIPAGLSGLGIPAPTLDLSGALSMGRLIPGLQKGLNPSSSMFNDGVGDIVSEVAGPVFGVPFAMYNALNDFSTPADDPKRWEKALPRAMKAMSRSSRYLAEQRERDRTGATIVSFDPNDVSDQMDILLGVGLGFQPTRLSQQWDHLTARKEVEDYWRAQRQLLMSEVYRAHRLKDPEGRKAAIEAVKKFNDEAPDRSLRITGDAIRQSVRARMKGKLFKEEGLPRDRALRGVAKDVDRLYPEVIRREKVPK